MLSEEFNNIIKKLNLPKTIMSIDTLLKTSNSSYEKIMKQIKEDKNQL